MESSTQTLIFPLTNRSVRQVFDYETDTVTFRLMYDSGARIPVWCSDDEFLLKAFPDAKKTDITARVTGFAREAETASVFVIPQFSLNDGNSAITINNLSVVVLHKPNIGCDFLLSETMVSKMDTFTFRRSKKEFHIVSDKAEYFCTAKKNNGELIDIAIWTQTHDK